MLGGGLISAFLRLSVSSVAARTHLSRNITTLANPLFIKATPCLFGEPLKKKKRLDPAIIKHREERRKKKLEKQIRRLEKHARQLKPIDEVEVPLKLVDQKELYARPPPELTTEEIDRRSLLVKDWARYKYKQSLYDLQQIDRQLFSQQQALDELRKESEELYQEAIQIDPALLPFTKKGPVLTPPIKDYESPDGEYIDTSKKWGKT
ncbi:39S ribosomal protein L40, mitochondrial-like isoform X1 [Schistocerca nitens]|uniref:39S ribosomal protein L40, mitochondrial-like isoform X1 n=1 Tax=Schistocerca nitens TaxID=7011 RepID=UPI0021173DE1|nr:39S ribosomal protein L40, mitochondrial-like isoform X1 [Schistocerca nitens]